ncbi:putative translation elongation factor G [Schistosoma mansoni]|uniref:Putative translation elongation factor G n=1 Tax=Schistosoma mansoni TaxID=6183 RepID=G4VTF6_SCHMA|nr:putative translation elongation factor G [Schistosoma mansoni]|eukprot:XP_018654612.1 putative translation elongation factor G [Schistosoma mansoni]
MLIHRNLRVLRSFKWFDLLNLKCDYKRYRYAHTHAQHIDSNLKAKISVNDPPIATIRNVGLIAHIDAGKTTTTERMLYYARRIHYLGEVDNGDTVTDYLPEERERGISIVTASASLSWRNHIIHLLDTPGHVDFTFEVERSLTVLDSVVVILDAVKGVQPQTHTVCRQAHRYCLPCVIYINKMDRPMANVDLCLHSLSNQLPTKAHYIPIHWPVFSHSLNTDNTSSLVNASNTSTSLSNKYHVKNNGTSQFVGLVDLTTMQLKNWISCNGPDDVYTSSDLFEGINTTTVSNCSQPPKSKSSIENTLNPSGIQEALSARMQLLSTLAEIDDEFADEFLQLDRPDLLVPSDIVHKSLKKAILSSQVIPVLVGSSRKNIGIQPLLDFIVDYLPDPSHSNIPISILKVYKSLKSTLPNPSDLLKASGDLDNHRNILSSNFPLMLVFRICFDPHRGPLTLVRLYSGLITPGSQIANWSRYKDINLPEKILNVFQLNGDSLEVVNSAGPGSIIALSGLQSTYTGDILGPVLNSTKSRQAENSKGTGLNDTEEMFDNGSESPSIFQVSEPVVYAAVEPGSRSEINALEHALNCMQREDPSFHVKFDGETGQWIISGMGDLHLDVILSRLKREYKVNVRMGPLLIAYKECPPQDAPSSSGWSRVVGYINGSEKAVAIGVILQPKTMHPLHKPQVIFDRLADHKIVRIRHAITEACLSALEVSGPILRSPIIGVDIHINSIVCGRVEHISNDSGCINDLGDLTLDKLSNTQLSSPSLLALLKTCCISSVKNAVSKIPNWHVMEPMMEIELQLPALKGYDSELSTFLCDLTNRRAEIISVDNAETSANCEDDNRIGVGKYHRICAITPLSELTDYSATIRRLSSGRAEFSIRLSNYHPVSSEQQAKLIDQYRWNRSGSTLH